MNDKVIKVINLSKTFNDGNKGIIVLENISCDISSGETVSIIGASGSGKSTLLQILAGLDRQTSGEVLLNNKNLLELSDNKQSEFRNKEIGFVFQQHHLLADFNALDNVMLPLLINRQKEKNIKEDAINILTRVGLGERLYHYPSKLSGGEKQRVAIARALVSKPSIILADEPTGSLDEETANEIMALFIDVVKERCSSLVMVTHDKELADKCDRIYLVKNKKLSLIK